MASSSYKWSDLFSQSSSDNDDKEKYLEETDSDTSIEENDYKVIEPAEVESKTCDCKIFSDVESSLDYLSKVDSDEITGDLYQCKINNVIRAMNFFVKNRSKLNDPYRLAMCDMFYRLRHEILFKFLCRSINLPEVKSDIPFRDFGIDSDRTPDLILQNEGFIVIIELSASSSFEKAAISKGLEESGFESKYQKELEEFKELKIEHVYVPFLFDMSNPGNIEYEKGFSKLPEWIKINDQYKTLLKYVKEIFCVITVQSKSYLNAPSTILFSRMEKIKKKHEDLSFLYKLETSEVKPCMNYKEFYVSPPVYNKVINNWHRLPQMLDRFDNSGKVQYCLETSGNRIYSQDQKNGLGVTEMRRILDSNDKFKFFMHLNLKVGTSFIKATESNDGVKFIDTTDQEMGTDYREISEILNHEGETYKAKQEETLGVMKYWEKLQDHFQYNYSFSLQDTKFEQKFIKMIEENDSKQLYEEGEKDSENKCYETSYEGFMAKKDINKIDIDEKFNDLIEYQLRINRFNEGIPHKIQKNKNPFLLPLAQITGSSYTNLNFKNETFIQKIIDEIAVKNPYTVIVLQEVAKETFEFINDIKYPSEQYNKLKLEKQMVSRELTQIHREAYKSRKTKANFKMSEIKDENIREKVKEKKRRIAELDKLIKSRADIEKIKNETNLIRLPTKNKKSFLGEKFEREMDHYKDRRKQSTITGVGYRNTLNSDYNDDKIVYDNITSWMMSYAGENPNLLVDGTETDDCLLLKQLKEKAMGDYLNLINEVKNSFLGHSASFVSNMAHSLMYYSQMAFNSDYIRVDNLGYKDVLLIVRGGKKIFKSKASKMYRLIYPINESIIPWIETGKGEKSSTTIFKYGENNYIVTPWQQMHESTLNDSISFYTRVLSFVSLNCKPEIPVKRQFDKISFNVILAFHNRRHTEVMLANLRYILLSTLGDFTGISEIFEEFMGFNYDCFQSFVRGSVLKNYPSYFKNLKKVKDIKNKTPSFKDYVIEDPRHLFSGSEIRTEEDLALMIYCTFLMTKAPYQRPSERARNLKGILEIHDYFSKTVGLSTSIADFYKRTAVVIEDDDNLDEYNKKLFSNDFNFDPEYCSQLGVFADSYYNSRGLKEEIFTRWNSVLNQSWDELATSTGLRGKFEDLSNFWGQKGYFVVYKDLISNKEYITMVKRMMGADVGFDKKRKMLRELNIIYKAKIEDESKEYLIFHAVDKVQWRGGREIYVMDIETKTVQQPIEKFMGYLCKKLDNELISIPSDRRAQVIHHSIFEKDLPMRDTLTWYLTLDCSKWAPKSNYLKFICTILTMTVLPPTFKTHFLNYTQKLFKKRIYFNEAEVDVLLNNPTYEKVKKSYLIHDKERKGYYILMPYSWVMGIFNYTSSFLHSLNQKYSEYIIFKTGLTSFSEETTLKMFAHSDDSGGRVSCKNNFMLTRCLTLYEVQLKMCNHLLSKKKSVISRFYFEILSVIYIFKKLLALLPKFLGGLRFTPSDKGPSQDMLTSYSKCIEVMVSGACFNVAYLVMKFYSAMIYRFYYHKRSITKNDYDYPVQYLGIPDAHPLMVLLCGSDSDIVRLLSVGKKDSLIRQHSVVTKMVNTIDDEGPIKPIKFNISVRGLKKGFEEVMEMFKEEIETWSMSNVNFHSTPFNFLAFLRKLNDPGFVGSLVNESVTRRISRSYHMRKGACISSTIGLITLENFLDYRNVLTYNAGEIIEVVNKGIVVEIEKEIELFSASSEKQISVLEETLVSPLRICRYMNELSLEGRQITLSTRSLKPTHIELLKSSRTFTCNFDPAQMVSYIKEPETSWALPNIRNLFTGKAEVESLCYEMGFNIDEINPSTLLKLCRNYGNKHVKEIYLYSQIPGEIRNIKTYSSFLTFLSTNTYSDKEIKGLVLDLRGNKTDPGYININIDEDVYIINNILSIIHTFNKACTVEFMKGINLKPIRIISWEGGSVQSLIDKIVNESKNLNSEHYNIQLNYLQNQMLEKFDSSCTADFLSESSYYYFPKPQRSRTGWYGKGKLGICIKRSFYFFDMYNSIVIGLESNVIGKVPKDEMSFIFDVLNRSGLSFSNKAIDFRNSKTYDLVFGVDYNGDYSVGKRNEISSGIYAKFNPIIKTPTHDQNFYSIDCIGPNTFLLTKNETLGNRKIKIYTLPLMQGEILNLIKMMFNPESFEEKLLTEGLNDFEDYILTEIMVNFGFETYVNPYDFFDNYQSSKLYKIMKEVKEKSISKIPNKISTSILPANEGSLLRILIDYSNSTNEKIIKTSGTLTPEIMELRSHYPENVSVVLSENLVKFHHNIYTEKEREEIKDSYQKLYKYKDFDELQSNAIKLMTHWGYGSLVNTIENYTLAKEEKNYWYFCLNKFDKMNFTLSSNLFRTLNRSIIKTLLKHRMTAPYLDLPLPQFRMRNENMPQFISEYLTYISNMVYVRGLNNCNINLSYIIFINYLTAYLSDEDFVTDLLSLLDKDYILCALEINFNKRKMFIAFYNSLFYNFINVSSEGKCKLNYSLKLQRLESTVEYPKKIYDSFLSEKEHEIPKYNINYFNFLNDDLVSFFKSNNRVFVNGIDYRVSQELGLPSKDQVPVCEALELKYVFNNEIFETEEWEEILSTIEMGDAEKEDIQDDFESIKNKFKKPKTKKMNYKQPTVQALINWVIDPYISNNYSAVEYYRQCGENIAVLGNDFIPKFTTFFPNSHCRRVNFSKRMKRSCPDMLVHISCNKMLNIDFWNNLIGGTVLSIDRSVSEKLYLNKYLISEGVIGGAGDLGKTFESIVNDNFGDKKEEEGEEEDEEIGVEKSSVKVESEEEIRDREIKEYEEKIKNMINNSFERGIISRALRRRLIEKYMNSDIRSFNSLEDLFLNCMNEVALGTIKSNLLKGSENFLKREDYVKVFLSPSHFGGAQGLEKTDSKNIKDKRVSAEINSINSKLASLIASGNLSISESFLSILRSNYKLWVSVTRGTNYKSGNKKYLVVLFLTIINTAKVFKESIHDPIWQDMINLYTQYIADEGPDEDEDEDIFEFDTSVISSSRLMYKVSGF